MWIEFTKNVEIGTRTYNKGRRVFFSDRNAETLIGAKKAKKVDDDLSGPASPGTSTKAKTKATKATTEK